MCGVFLLPYDDPCLQIRGPLAHEGLLFRTTTTSDPIAPDRPFTGHRHLRGAPRVASGHRRQRSWASGRKKGPCKDPQRVALPRRMAERMDKRVTQTSFSPSWTVPAVTTSKLSEVGRDPRAFQSTTNCPLRPKGRILGEQTEFFILKNERFCSPFFRKSMFFGKMVSRQMKKTVQVGFLT